LSLYENSAPERHYVPVVLSVVMTKNEGIVQCLDSCVGLPYVRMVAVEGFVSIPMV